MNIPTMSSKTFSRIQENLADLWEDTAMEKMAEAAEEEKHLAIQCGDVTTDGLPSITVVCDGVWAERSYRSNYNSLSGAAAIVGFKTGEVLFLAVKNKFCLTCKKHPRNTPQHKCYKNWQCSSSSMEANIMAEGFQKSMPIYGLIYNRMVADGEAVVMIQYCKQIRTNPTILLL
ncbi:hypothetical protein JTB14_007474 [Gonioctena quinquepunctata]|nr:hypothetical protein JTB14_007474 [Gonioctena quinquepunctata]